LVRTTAFLSRKNYETLSGSAGAKKENELIQYKGALPKETPRGEKKVDREKFRGKKF